jgi:hypothetical protein
MEELRAKKRKKNAAYKIKHYITKEKLHKIAWLFFLNHSLSLFKQNYLNETKKKEFCSI